MLSNNIKEYDIKDKTRLLEVKPSGVVSSMKYFPVFKENGKERIFKPLSKTKPYSTPLFSYSEAYWSYFINKYIDKNTPVYEIATCKGLSEELEKYYEKGVIVDNVLGENENFINLLELFLRYPDNSVDIKDYVNYCEVQYDYEEILRSNFFSIHRDLGKELAKQILCSILRRDENFHYENVAFIEENGKIKRIAPMLDMEFSQMFMFPDELQKHKSRFSLYDEGMGPLFSYDEDKDFDDNYFEFLSKLYGDSIYDKYDSYNFHALRDNLKTITELYPDMCKEFLNKLHNMRSEVINTNVCFDDEFLSSFSSSDWEANEVIFKQGKSKKSEEYLEKLKIAKKNSIVLDKIAFNRRLKNEVLWSIDKLSYMIEFFLNISSSKTSVILDYDNKTLYDKVKRANEETLKEFMELMEIGKTYRKDK